MNFFVSFLVKSFSRINFFLRMLDLSSPKTITLADNRFKYDFFLQDFYLKSIPEYLEPYMKVVNNNQELEKAVSEFWETA